MPLPSAASAAAVLTLALGLAAAVPCLAQTGSPPLEFKGAKLGMSLDDWRALPVPPADVGATLEWACSDEDRVANVPGFTLSAEEQRTGVIICSYVTLVGDQVLPRAVLLDENQAEARELFYRFAQNRLIDIRYKTTVDVGPDLTDGLTKTYGPPQTASSTVTTSTGPVQREQRVWRTASGTATILDPSEDDLTQLSVRLSAP